MSLGDIFSDSIKAAFACRSLKIGIVLKLKVYDTNPPKEKRFIIVGIDTDGVELAAVYINSKVNLLCNHSQELIELQHYLPAKGREYLNHDSFVDCAKLYLKDKAQLNQSILDSPTVVIGQVSEADISLIRAKIASAKTIKGKVKKRFGLYD